MLWINFGKWNTKSTNLFIWERVFSNGKKWTPLIMSKIRYPLNRPQKTYEDIPPPIKESLK